MALQLVHTRCLLSLRAQLESFRNARSLMDIGEQNWFGRDSFAEVIGIARDVGVTIGDADQDVLLREDADRTQDPFGKAKLFFRHILGIMDYEAIDLNGTKLAKRIDLNHPHDPPRQFDIVLNLGTTEHVFNQYEAFNTIHKLCRPGGLMIHNVPMSGYREHGFFNYHSTFFFDLAARNGYAVKAFWWIGQKTRNEELIGIVRSFADRFAYLEFIKDYPPREPKPRSSASRKPRRRRWLVQCKAFTTTVPAAWTMPRAKRLPNSGKPTGKAARDRNRL